jgi:hypothetical protein
MGHWLEMYMNARCNPVSEKPGYMFFHDTRHPKDMGAADIEAFLTPLAVQQKVAASTHNQALSA